jgi:hypothetical protein
MRTMVTTRRAGKDGGRSSVSAVTLLVSPVLVLLLLLLLCASASAASPEGSESSGAAGSALPDGRVDELVSNTGTVGEPYHPYAGFATFLGTTLRPFQAAADGDAMTYVGEPGITGGNGETGPGDGIQWLAKRTEQGWQAEVITPTNGQDVNYQAFSSDLSTEFVAGLVGPPSVPETLAGCQGLYSRADDTGSYSSVSLPSGIPGECGKPLFAGASADGSQVIFQSEAALTSDAQPATELLVGHEGGHQQIGLKDEGCMYACNLYDSVDGRLRLVNVIEGRTIPNATFGGYGGERETALAGFSNAISNDGSRIFWTDTQAGEDLERVYVLEDGASTVQVSGTGPAEYWTATSDGHYAYYTEAGELWQFDTLTNTRTQLVGPGSGVLGVIGSNQTGEDGGYLYFVAEGVLSAGKNAHGDQAQNGQPNLYLRHGGEVTFVATLDPHDNIEEGASDTDVGNWQLSLGARSAEVTPDGQNLIFQSKKAITGYHNVETEVFVYSAADGQLMCSSCNPTAATPILHQNATETKLPVSTTSNTYMRRWISNDGARVFFNSIQSLVPSDRNGKQDVYEWEREGSGTCAAQTPPRLNHGCVFLLSGGASSSPSYLIDADDTGDNVFFEHLGPLGQVSAPEDHNELYDARVNGGFPQSSQFCTGTGCQSVPPAPPSFATPASATFAGTGNFPPAPPVKSVTPKQKTAAQVRAGRLANALRACKKDRPKKARTSCERRAHAKYRISKAKRASNERRVK